MEVAPELSEDIDLVAKVEVERGYLIPLLDLEEPSEAGALMNYVVDLVVDVVVVASSLEEGAINLVVADVVNELPE